MSSAGLQKLFCGIYLAFKCTFDKFVGEKVFSPSYSSAKLAPPPNGALLDLWREFQHSSRVGTPWGNLWSFVKRVEDSFEFQGKRGLSVEMLQRKRASLSVQARISSFACSCVRKLRVLLELPVDLRDRSCFLREVRAALALRGPRWDSSPITAGVNRASSQDEAGTSVFLSISDFDCRVSAELEQESQASSCDKRGTPLASCIVHGVTDHLSSCIWNLRLLLDDATGVSVSLRVVISSSGLHSKRCLGIGTFLE